MIKFKVNGADRQEEEVLPLVELLEQLDLKHQRLAVEINEEIIRRDRYEEVSIKDGDLIEIVSFVGGG